MLSNPVLERATGLLAGRSPAALLRGSALVFAGLLVARGSGFLSRVIVGRGLGAADLGRVSAIISAVVLLGAVSSAGLQTTITTFSARYRSLNRPDLLVRLRRFSARWQQLAIVAVTVGAAGLAWWRGPGSTVVAEATVMAATASAFVLLSTRVAWFRGAGDTVSSFLSQDLTRAAVYIGVLQVLFVADRLSVLTILVSFLTAHVLAVVVTHLVPGRWTLPAGRAIGPGPIRMLLGDRRAVEREWVGYAAPLATSTLLENTAGRSVDVLLLALLLPAADVGLYAAALTVSALLGLALQAVTYLALPDFATTDDPGIAYRARRRSLACWTLAGIAGWGVGAGGLMVPIFGDGFAPAADMVTLFAIGHLVANVVGPAGPLALAGGRSGLHLVADIASIVTFWVAILVLVPRYGVLAAAAARALSQAVFNLLLSCIVFRSFGVRFVDPVVALAAGAAVAVAAVGYTLDLTTVSGGVTLAALVCVATAGLVTLTNPFNRSIRR